MTVHSVIVFSNKGLILCDTGYKNQLSQIEHELNQYGFSIKDITKVVITHHDHDHIGSLKSIKDKNNDVEIISSKIEAEYIIDGLKVIFTNGRSPSHIHYCLKIVIR
jgi:glyoxylase-like metal-dependent hydrolase (beta-lactamase superfamily II)